jgi:hypothetical protein
MSSRTPDGSRRIQTSIRNAGRSATHDQSRACNADTVRCEENGQPMEWSMTHVVRHRRQRPDDPGARHFFPLQGVRQWLSPPDASASRSGRSNCGEHQGRWCDRNWHNGPPDSSSPGKIGPVRTTMKRRYSEIATIPITEQPATLLTCSGALSIPDCCKFSTTTTLRPC